MTRDELQRGIQQLESLRSPPGSVDRIFTLASDPESHVDDLAQAIETDPAIAARLLRLANSAYFGFSSRIGSVSKAIVVLGYRTVQNLAACVALAPAFRGIEGSLDRCRVWLHSCAVAEAARLLALELHEDAPTAYLAGLLHDLGQVVLDEVAPKAYAEVLTQAARGNEALRDVERSRLGLDHADAGGLLADLWRLPPSLREAIGGHERSEPSEPGLLRIVLAAEQLAALEGFVAIAGDGSREATVEAAARWVELGPDRFEALHERYKQRREALELLHRESWREDG